MTLTELLDQARARANLHSDYALSKATGIPQQVLTGIRKGRRHPSNEEAVKLATLAGLDEMQVIAEIEYQTANTEKKKEFWKCYLENHGITATACFIALGISLLATPDHARASVLHLQNYGAHSHVHKANGIYIMRAKESGTAGIVRRLLFLTALPSCYKVCQFHHSSGVFWL